jgi:DtxR family Mn-dependent transcriptional regulator
VLGLNWAEAHDEACEIEHAISPRVENALSEFLGNPTTCPHGNPIPGNGAVIDPATIPLKQAESGSQVIISYISEEAEHEPGLLQYLQEHKLTPGRKLQVKGGSPFDETVSTVNEEGQELSIGTKTAQRIWVVPS